MADSTVRGRFVWHELMTPNAAGAHEFYSKVFGWTKQPWEDDPSYSMFSGPKGPLGATVEVRDGTPQWVPYISTEDVDATVAAAQRLGATVKTPTTAIPNAGTHAVLADPQGATFGVHSSSSAAPPHAGAEVGEFFWHELATTAHVDEAAAFYTELFGWDVMARHDMGPPTGIYLIFGQGGKQLGGMFNKADVGRAGGAYWLGYVRVADLNDTVGEIKAARGGLLSGPMTVPGGDKVAQFNDPHGAFFAAHMQGGELAVSAKPAETAKPAKPAREARAAKPAAAARSAKPSPAPLPRKKTKKAAKKAKKAGPKKAAKKIAKKTAKKAGAKNKAAKRPTAKKQAPKKKAPRKTAARKTAKKKSARTTAKRPAKKKPAKTGRKTRHGGDAHLR